MRRFLEGLTEGDEAVVLAGRCYEQESVAYKALDTLIDALIRYLRRLSRHEADVLMPRDVPALARVFPVLRRVVAVAEAPQWTQAILDQQELRRRAFAAPRELLARISDRRPLVLAIDDLQWGDADGGSLLSDLLRPPDPPALLLVGVYRSEDAALSPCLQKLLGPSEEDAVLRDRREVAVAALSPSEGQALALTLIGQDDEAAQRLAETIVRETGGSPYFIYELVQYLREGGELGESLAAASSDVRLDEVLWRRIQRLPDEVQNLLEVLAVAGQPIRQALACRIAGLGAEGFSSLALLRSHRLIHGTGPGSLGDAETYHDRIRETVVNHLPAERRRGWHRGLAQCAGGRRRCRPGDAGRPLRRGRRGREGGALLRAGSRRGLRGVGVRPRGQALPPRFGTAAGPRCRGAAAGAPGSATRWPTPVAAARRRTLIKTPPPAPNRLSCSSCSAGRPTSSSPAATSTRACRPSAPSSTASGCPCPAPRGMRCCVCYSAVPGSGSAASASASATLRRSRPSSSSWSTSRGPSPSASASWT